MTKGKLPQWAPPPQVSCLSCNTMGISEWCVLGKEQLQLIDEAKTTRHYQAGETIYRQGEACRGIYCVEQGTVALRMIQEDGTSKILRIADAGKTVGYSDFFGGSGYRTSAVVLEDAAVCHIPAEPLRQVLNHNPALGLAFLSRSSEDLVHADAMNMQHASLTVRKRLVHLLLSLKTRHGITNGQGEIVVTMPLSWQDAAELIGARAETVSRMTQALAEEGIIHVAGHRVTIPDLDLLLDEIETADAGAP